MVGFESTVVSPGRWVSGMVHTLTLLRLKIKSLSSQHHKSSSWQLEAGLEPPSGRTSYAISPLQGPIGFRGPPGIPGAPGKVVCMYLGWKVDFTPA